LRTWRTRPGENIKGIPPGSKIVGQGVYQGRKQWVYFCEAKQLWYRITQMADSSYTIEEYTQPEMDAMPGGCKACGD